MSRSGVDFRVPSGTFPAVRASTEEKKPGLVARALWTGAFAGLAAGAGDALLSFGRLSQFLGFFGKLTCILYSAALYGFWLGLAGAGIGAAGALLQRTALRGVFERTRRTGSLARTSVAMAAVPVAGAAL